MSVLTLRTGKTCSVTYILVIMVCDVCVQDIGGQSHGNQDLIQRIKDQVRVTMSTVVWRGMNASLAIDGNNRTDLDSCQCCTVALHINSQIWWAIDLGMLHPIKLIQFFGRDDESDYNQFKGFKLSLSNVSTTSGDVFYTNDENLPGYKFDIPVPNTLVRHINISKWTILVICEVKVFEGDCRTGNFGDECSKECHCNNNVPCNITTGICQLPGCKSGWQGGACDIACSNKTFGPHCSQRCHCKDDTVCNIFTGNCKDGLCAPGYDGLNCSIECPTHTHGVNCSQKCGQCKDDSTCDPVTGACPFGCTEDYAGSVCTTKKENFSGIVIAVIVGGIAVLLVIAIGVVITRCYLKKKKTRQEEAERENNYTALNHLQPSQESTYAAIEVNTGEAEYVNINTTTEPRKTTSERLCGCVC